MMSMHRNAAAFPAAYPKRDLLHQFPGTKYTPINPRSLSLPTRLLEAEGSFACERPTGSLPEDSASNLGIPSGGLGNSAGVVSR